MTKPNIAIIGATGAVGQEFLKVLEKRNFRLKNLILLASKRSAGRMLEFRKEKIEVRELNKDSFSGVDIALFSAGGNISRQFAPYAVEAGTIVIDNSSAFRMDPDKPLVIPEINPEDIKNHRGIISNPNCSTIIMLMALFPIHRINHIERIIVSTYQAASGAGAAAMEELRSQATDTLAGKPLKKVAFPHPIAFNAFSHDSKIDLDSGYNLEEIKMVQETHKILHDRTIKISPTCIRIGTFRAHGESIHLDLKHKPDMAAIKKAIIDFPGVALCDDRQNNRFPMPLEASGKDDVFVGRLRKDMSQEKNSIELFCCGDQLLKGAALNAVQIAELL